MSMHRITMTYESTKNHTGEDRASVQIMTSGNWGTE